MDLVELPTISKVKEGLLPCMVMELHFAKFMNSHKLGPFHWKCWQTHCFTYDSWRNYQGDNETEELEGVHLGPIFQSSKIITLNDGEVDCADCLVFPFQVKTLQDLDQV